MTKVLAVVIILMMAIQVIKPLGFPGLRQRRDCWKLAVFALAAISFALIVGWLMVLAGLWATMAESGMWELGANMLGGNRLVQGRLLKKASFSLLCHLGATSRTLGVRRSDLHRLWSRASGLMPRNGRAPVRFSASLMIMIAVVFVAMPLPVLAQGEATLVRIGDLVFAIPDKFRPAVEKRHAKSVTDELNLPPVPIEGAVDAEGVVVDLSTMWSVPSSTDNGRKMALLIIPQASWRYDVFCTSESRIGDRPDSSKALHLVENFYVFNEHGIEILMAKDGPPVFGAPIAFVNQGRKVTGPHETRAHYRFQVALAANTAWLAEFTSSEVPLPRLHETIEGIEKQIKSWVVYPPPEEFRWLHQERGACQ